MNGKHPLIEIDELTKCYRYGHHTLRALNKVSLSIYEQEILGLAGESGCGKSTLGKLLVRLIEPSSGSILYRGQNIHALQDNELKKLRCQVQMVFQNPSGALNPKMTVEEIVREPFIIHGIGSAEERKKRCRELLDRVGIPLYLSGRLPAELSGGQKQRVSIARSLALNPRFLILDESLSALDASIQAQIVNLLKDVREQHGLTYLFISHDLSMMHYLAGRIAIMYLGEIVELASSETLWNEARHPYTLALLSAIPRLPPYPENRKPRMIIQGEMPSPLNPPKGCPFHTRCPFALPKCKEIKPEQNEINPGHFVACHLY